ncbi:MAG: superoxide dismutase [Alphaproteobacteria bacterium]|nr:superoxide dismutase [Alphaproteobacteria bacterium]
MTFTLPSLPYPMDALSPYISARTMEFHYGKHHNNYVNALNDLVANTDFEKMVLEGIILATSSDESKTAIFNNAAQNWNHTFFWRSMKPKGGGQPSGKIAKMIERDFGDLGKFAEAFKKIAISQFGSGWVWLVLDGDGLSIVKTPNAGNPLTIGRMPLFCCDVWEHAYYLDYQNRRADFVQDFLDNLVNWDFANSNIA